MADLKAFREKVHDYRFQAGIESKEKKDKARQGMTQQELADACGYTRSELNRQLNGKSPISPMLMKQIVKALAGHNGITTKSQAKELLTLMDVPDFSPADWDAFPLKLLETEGERMEMELEATHHHAAEQKRPRENLEQPRKDIVVLPIAGDFLYEENKEDTELSRSLTRHRLSKGWTQEELSEKSQVPVHTIQRIEEGIIKSPTSGTLQRLANAFGIDVVVLKEACCDGIASDTVHATNSPPDNDQTVTSTPGDPAEATASSSMEWKPKNKVLLCLFIINVTFAVGAVYFFLQEGVVVYIIGSVLGVLAVYDIALVPLLNSHDIEQRLKKWLRLPEAANSKRVIYRIASIKVSLLLLTILTLTVTLRLLSVNISGEVSCVGGEQVKGVWVQSVNGGSGFATKNKTNSEGSEVVFNFNLQYGGMYNVHVGCGGSEQYWNNSYYTEKGTGPIQDHTFHYFACLDVPTRVGNGPCMLKY